MSKTRESITIASVVWLGSMETPPRMQNRSSVLEFRLQRIAFEGVSPYLNSTSLTVWYDALTAAREVSTACTATSGHELTLALFLQITEDLGLDDSMFNPGEAVVTVEHGNWPQSRLFDRLQGNFEFSSPMLANPSVQGTLLYCSPCQKHENSHLFRYSSRPPLV